MTITIITIIVITIMIVVIIIIVITVVVIITIIVFLLVLLSIIRIDLETQMKRTWDVCSIDLMKRPLRNPTTQIKLYTK